MFWAAVGTMAAGMAAFFTGLRLWNVEHIQWTDHLIPWGGVVFGFGVVLIAIAAWK